MGTDDAVRVLLDVLRGGGGKAGRLKGAYTIEELREKTGMSKDWIAVKLRALDRVGRLEVLKRPAMTIDRRNIMQTVYRVLPKDETKTRVNGAARKVRRRKR